LTGTITEVYTLVETITKLFRYERIYFQARRGRQAKRFETY